MTSSYQKQLEDEGEKSYILSAEQQLQLNKLESMIISVFKGISLQDPEDLIRSQLRRQKLNKKWDFLPLEMRYSGILTGLSRQVNVPERSSVVANIEAYWDKVKAMPEDEKPDWSTQYDEISKLILRVIDLQALYDLSKRLFKPGKAEQWAKKVRNVARYGDYTWREVLGSITNLKWTTTKMDHVIVPDQEDWDLLEAWGQYLDTFPNPKKTSRPQNKHFNSASKQSIVCGYCKKKGHIAKDCYHRK